MTTQIVRATVVGDNEIAGVAKGGTVDLDPAEVNIDALVAGGHVEIAPAATCRSANAAEPKADG